LLLLGGALLFFTGEGGFAFVGLAFWLFYLATFAAERLRLGPFTNIVPRS
jgi:hypothetical protein